VTADELAHFVRVTEARFGLRVDDRPGHMAEVCLRRAGAHRESVAQYLARVDTGDPTELRALATELTVGETYFFRHAEQFHAFADVALPERARARARVRVLSAGCSSGEEAYTMAMLVRDRVAEPSLVSIQAVDINPSALERAARGRYSRWALRATPPELEQRWFHTEGRDVMLSPNLRRDVAFEERNLIDESELWAPGKWDIVFCRNVLMYFTEACAQLVIDRLTRALAPGGYLFLGHAETLRGRSDDFELCHTHGTFYYQRQPGTRVASTTAAVERAVGFEPAPLAQDVAWYEGIHAATQRVHAIVDDALATKPAPVADSAVAAHDAELGGIRDLFGQERFAEALARLATLPPELASDPAVVLLRALALTHAGRLGEAETSCRELLAADPTSAAGHYLFALCRESAGDISAAADHARQASDLDASFAMARVQLGLLARRAGRRDAAAKELAQAIALLEREDPARLVLFGGGFSRQALIALCRSELASAGGRDER
jgi:chemotaxis protein methyltransferase CheR